MTAELSLREGRVREALAKLQEQVRKSPAHAPYRIFLFQLLAVLGEWDRALNQLNVAGELDAAALPMVQTYRETLQCEVLRAEIYTGQRSPLVFGEPAEWHAWMLQALKLTATGQDADASALRARALEAAPANPGSITCALPSAVGPVKGTAKDEESLAEPAPFAWLADADSRLGPILEAIINGRFYWVPLERVRAIKIDKPSDLRDLVWTAAHFEWTNGGTHVGFIPTRYPATEKSDDGQLLLARATEWAAPTDDTSHGLGQRMFTTDEADYSILEVREIRFDETNG
ncbi:MAG: type VI secretion system accessory protein TagJ [Planctomycetota bacterium]